MHDREEITDALYRIRAGSDPDTFLRTLRAYVLQHTETPEQVTELLCDMASVNSYAFATSLQYLTAKPGSADARRISPKIEARLRELLAHGAITALSITAAQKPAPVAKKARPTKRAKRKAR